MRNWLLTTWDYIRTSLWFVPSLMFVVGVLLAVAMLWMDPALGSEDQAWGWWINSGNGEDARNLLSTLLAGTIGMASMAFSVTVVALSLAANTYGPRLIRIFRADLRTQLALGMFVMVIVYCLIVLRTVKGQAPMPEVPHVAVTVGTELALLAVLALLVFIQGVARLIAADEVVSRVRKELDAAVLDLPSCKEPEPIAAASDRMLREIDQHGARIRLPREGYVQAVDYEGMTMWAEQNGCVLGLKFTAGDFVVEGDHRVLVHPPPGDHTKARADLDKFIVSGNERTPIQDLEFAIRHLVEIALRALSPGINDPFTAKTVIDRLRGALSRLMGRRLPSAVVTDKAGHVRLIRPATSHGRVLDAAFH
ncbi:MAG TPA: DUF2254 domain-containing protein [Mesorhizobium sp.]|jgi:uncharacterized membrane protein|nr:DUF2254 domain-containing protein [Mesorhizobium sp.]